MSWAMWRIGFFFHEMGFGLLSIFLPLFVYSKGGSLVEIGILTAVALLVAIPASYLWGYLSDKSKHYKRYILLSFLSSAVLLVVFTQAPTVIMLTILYSILSFMHQAHEAPKNVLIAESYSHQDWELSFARYEGLTEVGWLIGLVLGFVSSFLSMESWSVLLLCSALNLAAFVLSFFLVADPMMIFERGLVSIEKSVDFASNGIFLASQLLDGSHVGSRLRRENLALFCSGLVLFSLATSVLFTPLPIFVRQIVIGASFPVGFVFAVFVLNTLGSALGYYVSARALSSGSSRGNSGLTRVVIFRGLLAFLLVSTVAVAASFLSLAFLTLVLILLGLANAAFLVRTLSLSMEIIPAGKAGLFNVLIGVGSACGAFAGPFMADAIGSFLPVFGLSGSLFVAAYVCFKLFA